MSGEAYVIQNSATLQCLVCAGKKSMTHALCVAPCTPIMLIHVSVSVVMLIVLTVLVVDLKPGRAAEGVERDGLNDGSMAISRRLLASVTRIFPQENDV